MRSIWDKYYSDAHGVIFVLDAADVGRYEEAKLAFGKSSPLAVVAHRHHHEMNAEQTSSTASIFSVDLSL